MLSIPAKLAEYEVTSSVSEIILVAARTVKRSVLHLSNVISDREIAGSLDSVLTAYLSTDGGASYDTGAHYTNDGLRTWDGGAWHPPSSSIGSSYLEPIYLPQNASLGCRLIVDLPDTVERGTSGEVHFTSRGVVSGNNVATSYRAMINKGSNTSPRSVGIYYHGFYYGANGSSINAMKLKWDGGGSSGFNFVSGHLEWLEE